LLVVKRFIIAAIPARPISPLCTAPCRIRPMDPTAFESAALVMSLRTTVYLKKRRGKDEGRVVREGMRGWKKRELSIRRVRGDEEW
jgi:hypothetical protein